VCGDWVSVEPRWHREQWRSSFYDRSHVCYFFQLWIVKDANLSKKYVQVSHFWIKSCSNGKWLRVENVTCDRKLSWSLVRKQLQGDHFSGNKQRNAMRFFISQGLVITGISFILYFVFRTNLCLFAVYWHIYDGCLFGTLHCITLCYIFK